MFAVFLESGNEMFPHDNTPGRHAQYAPNPGLPTGKHSADAWTFLTSESRPFSNVWYEL